MEYTRVERQGRVFHYRRHERGDRAPCCGCEIIYGTYEPSCPCQCHEASCLIWRLPRLTEDGEALE